MSSVKIPLVKLYNTFGTVYTDFTGFQDCFLVLLYGEDFDGCHYIKIV